MADTKLHNGLNVIASSLFFSVVLPVALPVALPCRLACACVDCFFHFPADSKELKSVSFIFRNLITGQEDLFHNANKCIRTIDI